MDVYAEAGGFDGDASFSDAKRGGGGQRGPQNLTPITCADLHSMTGEKWTFENHQAEKVSLVGIVRTFDHSSVRVVLKIDDRTGQSVECQSMDTNDPELEKISIGMYIKVFGHLRKQSTNKDEGMKPIVTVIKVRALNSINDVSRHMLECVHARMSYLTMDKRAEAALGKSGDGSTQAMGGIGNNAGASLSSSGAPATGSSGVSGLSRLQDMVYISIREGGGMGIDIEKVIQKLSTHGLKPREIRDAVEFLQNEGHIYTTINDDTYACVDGM